MKKSDIEHIQRSRFLESGKKLKAQVDNIVRSINFKYPELARSIEIPKEILNQQGNFEDNQTVDLVSKYLNFLLNRNLLT
jgi:hypothetical protein